MNEDGLTDDDPKYAIDFVRRADALDALAETALTKRGLAEALSVSRPTAHRILAGFEELGAVRSGPHGYELTRFGEVVHEAVTDYRGRLRTARSLRPLLNDLPDDMEFEYELFTDAVITEATYDDPFRPMNRFIELFKGATRVKGFNRSFLEPMYIELAHERIEAGLESDVIYDPKVIELVLEEYPNLGASALEKDHVSASVHDDLPIALAIFEDRIGIGIHTESRGTPIAWIDTGDPDAIAWGERLFERYREEATQLY